MCEYHVINARGGVDKALGMVACDLAPEEGLDSEDGNGYIDGIGGTSRC